MENKKVNVEGKELDYYETSNSFKADLVDVFKRGDEFISICKERNLACIISFIPYINDDNKAKIFSTALYDPYKDGDSFKTLFSLTDGMVNEIKNKFGLIYKFEKFDPTEIKKK